MRRHLVPLLTMLTMVLVGRVSAQTVFPSMPLPQKPQATREDVVARLMSFDRDDDGRLARVELPERMHDLLSRGDSDNNQVLDLTEVRRLAESPTTRTVARGLEPGQYGFGDGFGVDTRLHIEGAIEDLRLSANEREKALDVARRFDKARQEKAKSELLHTMEKMLTSGSLADFKTALDRPSTISARPFPVVQANIEIARADAPAVLLQAVNALTRVRAGGNLARLIDRYGLQVDEQKQALAAIERFNEATTGTLGDADREGLLAELHPLLDEEQLDDLRAALERRPIVKQNPRFFVRGESFAFPADAAVHRLVVKD